MMNFSFLFHSLRFRLIASVVTIEVIMLSLLVWNNITIIHSTHTDRLRDTATSMIQQIANTWKIILVTSSVIKNSLTLLLPTAMIIPSSHSAQNRHKPDQKLIHIPHWLMMACLIFRKTLKSPTKKWDVY